MKKVTLSSLSHSARRRGCTLVVNLNPAFSLINTTPAGVEALTGEIILQIPEDIMHIRKAKVDHNSRGKTHQRISQIDAIQMKQEIERISFIPEHEAMTKITCVHGNV